MPQKTILLTQTQSGTVMPQQYNCYTCDVRHSMLGDSTGQFRCLGELLECAGYRCNLFWVALDNVVSLLCIRTLVLLFTAEVSYISIFLEVFIFLYAFSNYLRLCMQSQLIGSSKLRNPIIELEKSKVGKSPQLLKTYQYKRYCQAQNSSDGKEPQASRKDRAHLSSHVSFQVERDSRRLSGDLPSSTAEVNFRQTIQPSSRTEVVIPLSCKL